VKIHTFKYFYPEAPRLINIDQPLFDQLETDENTVAEPKKNGQRLQLHFEHHGIEFWSRHGTPLVYTPSQEIVSLIKGLDLPGYCILDGELRHNKTIGVRHKIMFFDVLVWDSELLITKPFKYRRQLLLQVLQCDSEPICVAPQYKSDYRGIYENLIKDDENEGLVIKNLQGILRLGRKTAYESSWMWKVRKPSGRYRW
jgi:ATP-dependent DNA ligase